MAEFYDSNEGITRRKMVALSAVGLAAIGLSGTGIFAYFSDRDSATNNLSIAEDLDIKLIEPTWSVEKAAHMVPGMTVPKDPQVTNTSSTVEGYIFVEVRIPRASVEVFENDEITGPSERDLFEYTVNDGWSEIERFVDGDFTVVRYAYEDVIVSPGETTPSVFDEITLINLIEGQGQAGHKVVTVTAYGIQAKGFVGSAAAWTAFADQRNLPSAPNLSTRTYAALYGSTLVMGRADETPASYKGVELTKDYDVDLLSGFSSQTGMPWFADQASITEIVINDSLKPKSMNHLFARLDNCTTIKGLEKIDTSECTVMSNVFFASDYITAVDLSSWDMSQVTTMSYMFSQAMRLTTIGDTSGWDLSNVTDMSEMFDNTKRLETVVGIDKWDVSHVTDMEGMFTSARGFKTLPIENWDTSSVTTMFLMFYDAQNVSVDCSGWDVSKVTNHSLFNTDAPGVIAPTWN